MFTFKRLIASAAVLVFMVAVAAWAQQAPPRQPPPQQAAPEQQAQMMLLQSLPLEGIMGFLVFEEELSDEQLLNTRDVLVGIYEQREVLSGQLQTGELEPEAIGEMIPDMRQQMVDELAEHALDAEQDARLRQVLGMSEH